MLWKIYEEVLNFQVELDHTRKYVFVTNLVLDIGCLIF